jgi:hypothetical protein
MHITWKRSWWEKLFHQGWEKHVMRWCRFHFCSVGKKQNIFSWNMVDCLFFSEQFLVVPQCTCNCPSKHIVAWSNIGTWTTIWPICALVRMSKTTSSGQCVVHLSQDEEVKACGARSSASRFTQPFFVAIELVPTAEKAWNPVWRNKETCA